MKCTMDIETTDLNPREGELICIGIKPLNGDPKVFYNQEDEEQMLRDFLDYFHRKNFSVVIGYNLPFDMRFLFARMMKYRIPANGFFDVYWDDLMHTMKSVKKIYSMNKPGKLDEWAQFLLDEGKLPISTSPRDFKRGDLVEIVKYNKQDLKITEAIWKRTQVVLDD